MKVLFTIFIFNIIFKSISCGQDNNLSSNINSTCDSTNIEYLGVKMIYPLTVLEAKNEYNLKYKSMYSFYKTVDGIPNLSKYVPYNFFLVFEKNNNGNNFDSIEENTHHKKIVKGYTFLLQGYIDFDSLKNSIENEFSGKFIKKEKIINSSYQELIKDDKNKSYFYELKISDCIYVSIMGDRPKRLITYVSFYFDMTESERSRFF